MEKSGKFLFLTDSKKGHLDLPGGRANEDESRTPLEKIISREVKEELGSKIKYHLGAPILQGRRYYPKKKTYVWVTVYKAKYVSGPIKLSFEHNKYQWIDPKKYNFKEKEFFNKEEYEAFKKYFKK